MTEAVAQPSVRLSNPVALDSTTKDWLEKPYILSQAFKKISQNFQVQVLAQGMDWPSKNEATTLGIEHAMCFVREIIMSCQDKPLSYGRVVIPMSTYQCYKAEIAAVGARPFGETFLYNRADIERSGFDFFSLSSLAHYPHALNYCKSVRQPELYFGRSSVFKREQNPLLVVEVLMPDLPAYPQSN